MSVFKRIVTLILAFSLVYLPFNHLASANTQPVIYNGIALLDKTAVYSQTSKSSSVLKFYDKGSILKYQSYSNDWYKAIVYVSGKRHTGYIHVNDVENAVSSQTTVFGIGLNKPTNVYQKASTNSTVLKSYDQGSKLKYRTFTKDWYEATVYVNGKGQTGYIHKSNVENISNTQVDVRGIGLKNPTPVYERASTGSKVLKSYSQGSILKYKTFSANWYEAVVYVNGKRHKGYIHKSHVENAIDSQSSLRGIGLKSPTPVYQRASTGSKALKSYSQGSILKYKTFSANWYEAVIYVNGKRHRGYIHKSHVENATNSQTILKGIGLTSPTRVYQKASTNSKVLKSYPAGSKLFYKTFSSNWYEATVYVNGKRHTGYIHKNHAEEMLSNPGEILKGRALKSPTRVYAGPSRSYSALKGYSKGTILKFKSLTRNWYEATVYINGKPRTGYIHVSDVTTKDVIATTNYNLSYSKFVDIQMSASPKADGAGKILASREEVEYYANPSNFPSGTKEYFQFLVLTAPAGLSATEINNKILINAGSLKGQGQAFVDAAKKHNINEVYLIAHTLHETGNGTSTLSKGIPVDKDGNVTRDANGNIVKNDKTVYTVYNMYGYGATDGNEIDGGAKYAFDNGWFTKYDAIVGGAANIGNNYIKQGQDTLYKMRWNPANPGTHQYATHVAWAAAQTTRIYNIYQTLDQYILVFDIPKFIDQPGKTEKPDPSTTMAFPDNVYGLVVLDEGTLNFRSGPSTTYSDIGDIPNGTKLKILGQHTNGWYEVEYNGKIGWVSNAYVELLNLLEITADSLNVRPEPNVTNNPVGGLEYGQFVAAVLDSNNNLVRSNEWYKIHFNDGEYWISSGTNGETYLKVVK